MPPRHLVLTGPPANSSLRWDEALAAVADEFLDPFKRFIEVQVEDKPPRLASNLSTSTSPQPASWRLLRSESERHLETGFSQGVPIANYGHGLSSYQGTGTEAYESTSFFTTADLAFSPGLIHGSGHDGEASTDEVMTQFYEHSLVIYEEGTSSQMPVVDDDNDLTISSTSLSDLSDLSFLSPIEADVPTIPPPTVNITPLAQIPTASFLNTISPQTMSVSLVVGIISLLPPRGIVTRRGEPVHLLELLVGDETKSGFCVNFWLSDRKTTNIDTRSVTTRQMESDALQTSLEKLRPRDVVLLQNVALSSFRGKVHGQSMRRARTRVWLLCRNGIDRRDAAGCFSTEDLISMKDREPMIGKMWRVREWTLMFLSRPMRQPLHDEEPQSVDEELPPDTQ